MLHNFQNVIDTILESSVGYAHHDYTIYTILEIKKTFILTFFVPVPVFINAINWFRECRDRLFLILAKCMKGVTYFIIWGKYSMVVG